MGYKSMARVAIILIWPQVLFYSSMFLVEIQHHIELNANKHPYT